MLEDNQEDSPLIDQLKEDDLSAFNLLYEKYRKALFIYALRYIKDEQVCYEMVQDAFIYLWQKRLNAVQDQNITSYLYAFIRSRSLNYLRDQSHKRTIDLNFVTDSVEHPTYEMENKAGPSSFLADAISCIPSPASRSIFEMRYVHEMSYKEIARHKAISINTVYVHINYALKIIRGNFLKDSKD